MYIFVEAFLQGWDYLAFSSPSAPSPVFFYALKKHQSPKIHRQCKAGFALQIPGMIFLISPSCVPGSSLVIDEEEPQDLD